MSTSSSSLNPLLNNRPLLILTTTALLAASLTATSILGFQSLRRKDRTEQLKAEIEQDLKAEAGGSFEVGEGQGLNGGGGGGGGRSMGEEMEREWGPGEFDEGLIREQVSQPTWRRCSMNR